MAQKFNSYKPPVKIDFLKLSYIRLEDREEEPIYHLEAFVDGEYVKHNSNAGYVQADSDSGISRRTPQCFSHFRF